MSIRTYALPYSLGVFTPLLMVASMVGVVGNALHKGVCTFRKALREEQPLPRKAVLATASGVKAVGTTTVQGAHFLKQPMRKTFENANHYPPLRRTMFYTGMATLPLLTVWALATAPAQLPQKVPTITTVAPQMK